MPTSTQLAAIKCAVLSICNDTFISRTIYYQSKFLKLRTENNCQIGKCLIHFQGLNKQHSTCQLLCFKRQFHAIPDLFLPDETIPFDKQVSSHGQYKGQKSYLTALATSFQTIQDDSCGLYIFL